MANLTEKEVLNDIKNHAKSWRNDNCTFTFTDSYNNAIHGYKADILHLKGEIKATVYELERNEDDDLEVGELLFEFII